MSTPGPLFFLLLIAHTSCHGNHGNHGNHGDHGHMDSREHILMHLKEAIGTDISDEIKVCTSLYIPQSTSVIIYLRWDILYIWPVVPKQGGMGGLKA